MNAPSVLIWVQHLLGTGHLRRAQALAHGLAREGSTVCLVSGGPETAWKPPSGVEIVKLPPLRAADESFSALLGEAGTPVDPVYWRRRLDVLETTLRRLRPQVVVTEHFPFGRRAFRHEVGDLLEIARGLRPSLRCVASARDVLVRPREPTKVAWMVATFNASYDMLLVHGEPSLVAFEASFPDLAGLAHQPTYTGYLSLAAPSSDGGPRTGVVVSAGGGGVGGALLRLAAEAAARCRLADDWLLITGQNAVEAPTVTGGPVRVIRHHPDFPSLLARTRVSVSQAGYNTVVEALRAQVPMVLVPFATETEDEQTIRAERLANLGRARHLPLAELSAAQLARAVEEAASASPPALPDGCFDGGGRAAAAVLGLAG